MKDYQQNLIELYLEGKLPPEKWDVFCSQLEESVEMRREFRKLSVLDENLRSQSTSVLKLAEKEKKVSTPTLIPWLIAVACLVFIFIQFIDSVEVKSFPKPTSQIISQPIDQKQDRKIAKIIDFYMHDGDLPVQIGEVLRINKKFNLPGIHDGIHLRFGNSVDFIFQGPGEFEVLGKKDVRITKGKVRVMILNEDGHEFTIHTKKAQIVDLGTEFSMHVEPGKEPRIFVQEGLVEIKSKNGKHSYGYLTRNNQPLKVSNTELFEKSFDNLSYKSPIFQPGSIGKKRKDQRIKNYLSDDDVLACFDFTEPNAKDRDWERIPDSLRSDLSDLPSQEFILNRKDSPAIKHGIPHKSTWSSGRFPETKSLTLSDETSHILLQTVGKFEEISLNAWICINQLTESWACIFGSEKWNAFGRFRLEIPRTSKSTNLFVWGEPVFSNPHSYQENRIKLNTWQMFTVTFDKIEDSYVGSVFLDGELQRMTKSKYLKFIEPGSFIVGNVNFNERKNSVWGRPLNGLIDELVIWKIGLDINSIKNLYTSGIPYHLHNSISHI